MAMSEEYLPLILDQLVLLDGTVGDDKIKFLLNMSYDLTKGGKG